MARSAFFRTAPINWRATHVLFERFKILDSDHLVDVYDVYPAMLAKKRVVAKNLVRLLQLHGKEILLGRKNWRRAFWRTDYIFDVVKAWAGDILSRNDYSFSFQLQSLFDSSRDGLPHFVYTDRTHLDNLRYPGASRQDLYSTGWIAREKQLYAGAACVFARSSNTARSLQEDYECPPERIELVYAGPNVPIASAQAAVKSKSILMVGTNWEQKGGPVLLETFSRIRQAHPDATLTIVGCSPAIELDGCKAVGRVPASEVGHYFRQASIYCMPANHEAFGIVFVEALHHGLPIVASDISAVPDFVRHNHNGYLIPVGDSAALAERLDELLADPGKRQRFGLASRRLAADRYNWDVVLSRMKVRILKEINSR